MPKHLSILDFHDAKMDDVENMGVGGVSKIDGGEAPQPLTPSAKLKPTTGIPTRH